MSGGHQGECDKDENISMTVSLPGVLANPEPVLNLRKKKEKEKMRENVNEEFLASEH